MLGLASVSTVKNFFSHICHFNNDCESPVGPNLPIGAHIVESMMVLFILMFVLTFTVDGTFFLFELIVLLANTTEFYLSASWCNQQMSIVKIKVVFL